MAMKDFFFNFFLLQTGIFKVCSFMFTKKIAFWLHTIKENYCNWKYLFLFNFFLNLEKNPPFFERSDDVLGWMF